MWRACAICAKNLLSFRLDRVQQVAPLDCYFTASGNFDAMA